MGRLGCAYNPHDDAYGDENEPNEEEAVETDEKELTTENEQ